METPTRRSSLPGRIATIRPAVAVLVVGLLVASQAAAISFTFNYDERERPPFDPTGARLRNLFNAAAAMYSDYLLDNENYEVDISWQDIGSLGVTEHFLIPGVNPNIIIDTRLPGGAPRDWFIDQTPSANEEFDFSLPGSQTLFRDLTAAQQSDWFNGDPPDLLEVGYRGSARTGTQADGRFDLYSTVVHELGHILGINDDIFSSDFSFNSNHIGGRSVEVEEASNGGTHLAVRTALMCGGCATESVRRLPSTTDLLAMAGEEGISSIDIPRQEFIGPNNGGFHVVSNWIGGRVPNGDNDTFVRHGGVLQLSNNATTRDLIVDEGSSIVTNAHVLRPFGETTVGMVGSGTIAVQNLTGGTGVPELDTQTLRINDGGQVHIVNDNGLVDVHRDLVINSGGEILGAGRVEVDGTLRNNGTITGGAFLIFGSGGTLTVEAQGTGQLDLDGTSGTGKLRATIGNLTIDGPVADPFSGTASIGEGRTLLFTQPWTLDGRLILSGNGSPGEDAQLMGAQVTVDGTVQVDGTNNVIFARPVMTDSGRLELDLAATGIDSLSTPFGAVVDGTLAVELADDFFPTPGSTYSILPPAVFGGVSGAFDQLELIAPSEVAFEAVLDYRNGGVTLRVVTSTFAGDFTGDAIVDGEDFLTWQANAGNFDGDATHADGDANGDGYIDGEDFLRWQSQFGTVLGGRGGRGGTPVPESSSLAVILIIAGCIAPCRAPQPQANGLRGSS